MINYKEQIAKDIAKITNVDENELAKYIEIPPNSEMGDYAFPCFKLAKELKKAPNIIANELKEQLNLDGETLEKVEIVGGYLNFYINKSILSEEVLREVYSKKEEYGASNIGQGKNVIVEYSSPNIAKPFHIGHLRSTVIGKALYNIYNFLGYNSIGINYLGDWGLQFGKVMAGISLWKDEYDFSKDEIGTILKIYVRYNKEEKENEELTNLARQMFKKLEEGDKEAVEQWAHIREVSLENYQKTYDLLNAKFDSYNGEAYYNDKMQPIIEELKSKNLLEFSQGAQVVNLDEYNMPPCIVVTSAGTTIYATRDIATLLDRIKTYDFAKALYVVGNEQQLHFNQVFKVVEMMGYGEYTQNCIHVPFGLVVDKDGEKIGSRKGNSVNLEDIINESIEKVKKIIQEKNPNIEDKEETARIIGVGAIIFNDLANSRIKDEIFDWEMLLNFSGETGPYIQYMYVRTKSILDKVKYLPNAEINYNLLSEESAISVIKLLYILNEILVNALEKNEPSILSRYLIDLAQAYSNFYNQCQIITEDEEIQKARLLLTYSVNIVIKNVAGLLGIQMPKKM